MFDLDDPMGESTCVACGECVQACPTGALAPAKDAYLAPVDKKVASVCPYCGVGCQLTYHVSDNAIVRVEGRDGPANHERLCVKGRFGFDYVAHPQRLTKPLIRSAGVPKSADFTMDPAESARRCSAKRRWEEALALAGGTLAQIRDTRGAARARGLRLGEGQRTRRRTCSRSSCAPGFGTNNVDHCTRLCHASSVAALLEGIGSGAVSNPVMDVMKADVVLLIGANPVVNHPVAATWIKNAVKNGTKLILADPRRSELARHATHYLQFKPDTDVALLNAMMHTIVEEGLVAESVHRRPHERLRGAQATNVAGYSPEAMAPVCGIPAQTIREVARLFATSKGVDDPVGHGHLAARARHRQRALPDRADDADRPGRPAGHGAASAARPEQRAGRVRRRPDPDDVPGLPARRQRRRAATSSRRCGARRSIRSRGSPSSRSWTPCTPARSAACTSWARTRRCRIPTSRTRAQALAELEMLVVQDIFLTETAYLADVILPASAFPEKTGTFTNTDRTGAARPAGAAAAGRGAPGPRDHRRHGAAARPRLDATRIRATCSTRCARRCRRSPASRGSGSSASSAVTYPCEQEGDPGERVVFTEGFPTATRQGAARAGAGSFPPPSSPTASIRSC